MSPSRPRSRPRCVGSWRGTCASASRAPAVVHRATAPCYTDGWAWTVTGVGLAGLAVGGGYWFAASTKRDELETADELEWDAIGAEADRRERIGSLALIGGGVVTAIGIGLLVYNTERSGSGWGFSDAVRSRHRRIAVAVDDHLIDGAGERKCAALYLGQVEVRAVGGDR